MQLLSNKDVDFIDHIFVFDLQVMKRMASQKLGYLAVIKIYVQCSHWRTPGNSSINDPKSLRIHEEMALMYKSTIKLVLYTVRNSK